MPHAANIVDAARFGLKVRVLSGVPRLGWLLSASISFEPIGICTHTNPRVRPGPPPPETSSTRKPYAAA